MSDQHVTPNGVAIEAVLPDGTRVNVTEGVQALYDLVINSMDWGSGFLTLEDAIPVAEIAEVCGFDGIEEARRYLNAERHKDERAAFWKRVPHAAQFWPPGDPRGVHEHVYSEATGECMWTYCPAKRLTDQSGEQQP